MKRFDRSLTAAEKARLATARQAAEEERKQGRYNGVAKRTKAGHDAVVAQIIQDLRNARESQELSLADIRDRSGFSRAALSRLENDLSGNPTVSTLYRYADALGKRLVITIEDE